MYLNMLMKCAARIIGSPKLLGRARATAVICVLGGLGVLFTPQHAQAQLPSLGDGVEISMTAERKLGDRIARELFRDPDHIDDPLLDEYVWSIWRRLLQGSKQRGELSPELESTFAWAVFLGRDRTVNAFALPGGYMGVHLGLIATVSSEDELASVLAHELSHITQRHIARLISRQSSQAPMLLGAMILGALAAGSNPQAATALIAGGQAVAVQGQLNFSREMEREADRVGYSVMTGSGYAPQGFVTMFEKLLQANRFNETGAFPYLRSHPLTTERIADMQARQQLLPTAPPVSDLTHYLLAGRARALSYLGVDAQRGLMTLAMPAAASSLQASKPEVQAGIRYAAVLAASNQRDFRQAWAWHTQLQEATRMNAAANRLTRLLAVEVALAEGQPRKALESLGNTWNPKSRSEFLLWSQAVLASAQGTPQTTPAVPAPIAPASDAPLLVPRLQAWVATYPRDAQAWQLLSSAYLTQGKTLRAVCAEAEGFAAKFDEQGALNRYRAAQDLVKQSGQPDFIEASIIDTRVRQLQARVFELSMER